MALSEDRLRQWQDRRAARLNTLNWLAQDTRDDQPGRKPAWYVKDEILVIGDHTAQAEQRLGRGAKAEELAPGLVRYHSDGLDVPSVAREVRESAHRDGDARVAAAPNHVFVSTRLNPIEGTPFEHGGPFGPPVPAPRPKNPRAGSSRRRVPVAVIDTGVWRNSPLPEGAYTATRADYATDTDVDNDGIIDGDVGHANFIIGVIAQETGEADIRATRLLDTFGVCREADLALALGRLNGERLINLSLGGFTLDDQPPVALEQALSNLLSGQDRLVVAAAGNNGQVGPPFWPAAFAATGHTWSGKVVAVAAHDGTGICDWSNRGDWVTLAAPGADITSTFVRHELFPSGWALWSGTSFATPYVVAHLANRLTQSETVDAALASMLADPRIRTFDGFPCLT
jgi:subtilisin family serine protease